MMEAVVIILAVYAVAFAVVFLTLSLVLAILKH